MDCKKARELLTGDLSGGLEAGEKAGLSGHLKSCEPCRKEQELLARSWQMLDMYEAPQLGGGFVDNLMQKVRSGQAENLKHVSGFNLAGARAVFAGWWKVPAFALVSCAIYALCVETGLSPERSSLHNTTSIHSGTGTLSTMLSDGREADGGYLLAMLSEGADK